MQGEKQLQKLRRTDSLLSLSELDGEKSQYKRFGLCLTNFRGKMLEDRNWLNMEKSSVSRFTLPSLETNTPRTPATLEKETEITI